MSSRRSMYMYMYTCTCVFDQWEHCRLMVLRENTHNAFQEILQNCEQEEQRSKMHIINSTTRRRMVSTDLRLALGRVSLSRRCRTSCDTEPPTPSSTASSSCRSEICLNRSLVRNEIEVDIHHATCISMLVLSLPCLMEGFVSICGKYSSGGGNSEKSGYLKLSTRSSASSRGGMTRSDGPPTANVLMRM